MPNLLWLEWKRDPEGYETLELKEDDLEVVGLRKMDPNELVGVKFDEPFELTGEPLFDSADESGEVYQGIDHVPPEHIRLREGASASSVRLMSYAYDPDIFFFHEVGLFIAPRSGKTITYRPLDRYPSLFMEFCELEYTPEAVIGFANKYGEIFETEVPVALTNWYGRIRILKEEVRKWRNAQQSGDFESLTGKDGQLQYHARSHVLLKGGADAHHPALSVVPDSLESALWLQFAQAVSSNTELRRCAWCPIWFAYGTGTGRRKSAHYCSDRCRKAAHRHKETKK